MTDRARGPTRIVVVGSTGSGKSTTARILARRLDLARIEMDAIHWGPDWTPYDWDDIRSEVAARIAEERWVLDGNYTRIRDLVWPRAELVLWLDYPFLTVARQLLVRTVSRIIFRERLWGNNRERWGNFLSTDSLFLWLLKRHWRNRRLYPALFSSPPFRHLTVVRVRSRAERDAWVSALPDYSATSSGSRR